MMLVGLVCGMLLVYALLVRPMASQVTAMQEQMSQLAYDIRDLAGQTERSREVGSLLSGLVEQGRHARQAAVVLDRLADLEPRIESAERLAARTETALDHLAASQTRIAAAAALTDSAAKTLASSEELHRRLVDSSALTQQAQTAWRALAELRTGVLALADTTPRAQATLDRMSDVTERLAAEAPRLADAQLALAELSDLRARVFNTACQVPAAHLAIERVEGVVTQAIALARNAQSAEKSVADWADLQAKLAAAGPVIHKASTVVGEMIAMAQSSVDQTETVERAWDVHESMSVLTAAVLYAAEETEAARLAFDGVEAIQSDVIDLAADTAPAAASLADAQRLQQTLVAEAGRFVEAVGTLELLLDLHEQFVELDASIERMRRSANEVVLLESALRRAFNVVQPMLKLSDLRRLNPSEVRRVVDTIREENSAATTRLVQRPE
jgi:hypothetical protein